MKQKITRSNKISRNLRPEPIVKTTHENLKTVWRISARAFFRKASQLIAIDTGMSMASMIPLATKVQTAAYIERQLAKATTPKKGWRDIDGNWHGETLRSRAQGIREAEKRIGNKHIIDFGSPQTPTFVFRFEIVIYQWARWENAWRAMEEGRAQFLLTYRDELRKRIRSEDIIRYMLTGRTTIRGE